MMPSTPNHSGKPGQAHYERGGCSIPSGGIAQGEGAPEAQIKRFTVYHRRAIMPTFGQW